MSYLSKVFLIAAQMLITVPALASTTNSTAIKPPTLPITFSRTSKTTLKYKDMDYLLANLVLPLGRSRHTYEFRPIAQTGTHFVYGNPNPSRLEGNRVMFQFIKSEDDRQFVKDVRDTLLALPDKVDFARLSKREHLAYWLNLHNAIMLSEMADRYPLKKVDRLFGDCEKLPKRFACDRRFEAFGQKISVTDIRNHVLANWQEPTVIYGFYMGAVGTPNIVAQAYSGENVYDVLASNAKDFVNSIRGTRMSGDNRVRVSTYYKMVAVQFPNFQTDLLRHLRKYAQGTFKFKLDRVEEVDADVSDWYIADLFNGQSATTANLVVTGRDGTSRAAEFNYPLHVQQLLKGVIERHKQRRGVVSVEEVDHGTDAKDSDQISDGEEGPPEEKAPDNDKSDTPPK
jgi:Protein of unknown function, DUF547